MAQDYAARKVNVVAMSQVGAVRCSTRFLSIDLLLQYDMTAWVKRGTREEVGVITDFTDSG